MTCYDQMVMQELNVLHVKQCFQREVHCPIARSVERLMNGDLTDWLSHYAQAANR